MKARLREVGIFLAQGAAFVLAVLFLYVMSLAMSGRLVTGDDPAARRPRTAEERAEAQPHCDYDSTRVC